MLHTRVRLVEQDPVGPLAAHADAEVRVGPAERPASGMTDARKERDAVEHLTPERHVRADEVANRTAVAGIPRYVQPTTQSNSSGNQRGRLSGHTGLTVPPTPITSSAVVAADDVVEPVRLRGRVVVQKGDDGSFGSFDTRVAGAGRGRLSGRSAWSGHPGSRARTRSSSSGLWSTTTRISLAGRGWALTEATDATSFGQRASELAQITPRRLRGSRARAAVRARPS